MIYFFNRLTAAPKQVFTKDVLTPEYWAGWIKADTYLNLEAFDEIFRVPQEKQVEMQKKSIKEARKWKKVLKSSIECKIIKKYN